jgi:ribosomal protein S18 acetylase RimI-like enzyme
VNVLDTLARNRPPEPHLYLNILGVDPALQRRHFGVTILDFLHDQAALRSDLAGVYLETATEANVAYYSHVGYRVLNEIHPLGVRVWRMMQDRGAR